MSTTAEKIAVMQAFDRGEQIECCWKGTEGWTPVENEELDWDWLRCEYRVVVVQDDVDWSHVDDDIFAIFRDNDGKVWGSKDVPSQNFSSLCWVADNKRRIDGVIASYKRGNVSWDQSLFIRLEAEDPDDEH